MASGVVTVTSVTPTLPAGIVARIVVAFVTVKLADAAAEIYPQAPRWLYTADDH